MLARCDIHIGGDRPWDITVNDAAFYRRVAIDPALHLGTTYMDGLWDCRALDQLIERIVTSPEGRGLERNWIFRARNTLARLRNSQSPRRHHMVADQHYNIGVELYERMLDETMAYTCAMWSEPDDTLATAQRRKFRALCDELDLKDGELLLDIGCGFGGLADFAAREYGARVVGVTNSIQHCQYARRHHRAGGAASFECLDYRRIPELGLRFDKAVSVEMLEAVGPHNFGTFIDIVHGCLAPTGRFVVQSFVSPTSQWVCNPWFDRYIFPNGVSPSLAQLSEATRSNFGPPRHLGDLGAHYTPTLLAWHANISSRWDELPARYDSRFRRMWAFYLLSLAGVFRAEDLRVCQLTYAKGAVGLPASLSRPRQTAAFNGQLATGERASSRRA